ncbi:MAG: hypothetical protein D6753_08105 [Planctomycetota bacterium]|nr:MAG: hypothetical protein D6753_08105 [Planctomycetota bacterium]
MDRVVADIVEFFFLYSRPDGVPPASLAPWHTPSPSSAGDTMMRTILSPDTLGSSMAPANLVRGWQWGRCGLTLLAFALCLAPLPVRGEFRAGAAKVDVSPMQLPVLVNGSMRSRSADQIVTRVHARALVLDDGHQRVAIVVVDSCMLPKTLIDEAKQLAASMTQLRPDRICVSATHTHTAPSSMGALGTDADPSYVPFIRRKIAEAIAAAESRLQPAEIGWASTEAPQFTAVRRWVRRPDRIALDPFGNPTVRANMHSGRNPDDATGPAGPEDPELSLICLQRPDGAPIAVLANFSMHYFQHTPISADYFGFFCDQVERHLRDKFLATNPQPESAPEPLAILSHGCSGDIWRRDYMQPTVQAPETIEEFSSGLAQLAIAALQGVTFDRDPQVAMLERRLPMKYRVPDRQRLEWAQRIVEQMGNRLPETQPEIYAREQVFLDQWQSTEVVVQALRIGSIAIATTPTETYAITGLKIKRQSPLEHTMVIELANGGDGYIPPPEQHVLGGYNTWAARSAGLEVTAEPRIVAADLDLLERVTGLPRRPAEPQHGAAAESILAMHPKAYWRLEEWSGGLAHDSSGNRIRGVYEPGVVFFLEGDDRAAYGRFENRCPHFAGGRLHVEVDPPPRDFRLQLSCWNGMPIGSRQVLGWMASCDFPDGLTVSGWHLGLDAQGRLILKLGDADPVAGRTAIPRWQWRRVTLERSGDEYRVYLNDQTQPEIVAQAADPFGRAVGHLFIGGRSDNVDNWEGKLDEIVLW